MNIYLILIIIALNVGYYYLTNWLAKKDLPKPEPHQTLLNLTSPFSARFHFFGVITMALLAPSVPKVEGFILLYFTLFTLLMLRSNFTDFLNPYYGYILFDNKFIVVKKELSSPPKTFHWQSLQKLDTPSLFSTFSSGRRMPKKRISTLYDSFEYPFAQDFFLFDWFYFDKNTNEGLKRFHQKMLEAIETNKKTEETNY